MRFAATLFAAALLAIPASAQVPPQEGTDAFNLGVLGAEGLPIKKPDEELKLPRGAVAIRVTKVLEGGPAIEAGLQKDDLIVSVGGQFMAIKHDGGGVPAGGSDGSGVLPGLGRPRRP